MDRTKSASKQWHVVDTASRADWETFVFTAAPGTTLFLPPPELPSRHGKTAYAACCILTADAPENGDVTKVVWDAKMPKSWDEHAGPGVVAADVYVLCIGNANVYACVRTEDGAVYRSKCNTTEAERPRTMKASYSVGVITSSFSDVRVMVPDVATVSEVFCIIERDAPVSATSVLACVTNVRVISGRSSLAPTDGIRATTYGRRAVARVSPNLVNYEKIQFAFTDGVRDALVEGTPGTAGDHEAVAPSFLGWTAGGSSNPNRRISVSVLVDGEEVVKNMLLQPAASERCMATGRYEIEDATVDGEISGGKWFVTSGRRWDKTVSPEFVSLRNFEIIQEDSESTFGTPRGIVFSDGHADSDGPPIEVSSIEWGEESCVKLPISTEIHPGNRLVFTLQMMGKSLYPGASVSLRLRDAYDSRTETTYALLDGEEDATFEATRMGVCVRSFDVTSFANPEYAVPLICSIRVTKSVPFRSNASVMIAVSGISVVESAPCDPLSSTVEVGKNTIHDRDSEFHICARLCDSSGQRARVSGVESVVATLTPVESLGEVSVPLSLNALNSLMNDSSMFTVSSRLVTNAIREAANEGVLTYPPNGLFRVSVSVDGEPILPSNGKAGMTMLFDAVSARVVFAEREVSNAYARGDEAGVKRFASVVAAPVLPEEYSRLAMIASAVLLVFLTIATAIVIYKIFKAIKAYRARS